MKEVRESLKTCLKSLLKKTDKEKLDKVKSLMKKRERKIEKIEKMKRGNEIE
jgi:hypothetical protein